MSTFTPSSTPLLVEPRANYPWETIGFKLQPTAGYAKTVWSADNGPEGGWGPVEFVESDKIELHVGNVAVNYGGSCFEGLKALRGPDNHVRVFRPQQNSARINHSSEALSLPQIPETLFLESVHLAVGKNLDLVPPHAAYGAAGTMYIRPLAFASGESLIPCPPTEYTFITYVTPTGSLYGKGGLNAPAVDAFVIESFDRAAPKGTGHTKAAGNYAPTFKHAAIAKKNGYPLTLHLDSKTHSFVDEFSTANFLAILKFTSSSEEEEEEIPTLVVPNSETILRSITTKTIIQIAQDLGWKVQQRPVAFSEIVEGKFAEVAACGTAAVLTPVRSITYHDTPSTTSKALLGDGTNAGPHFLTMLKQLTGIQSGVIEDRHDWCWPKEGVDGAV